MDLTLAAGFPSLRPSSAAREANLTFPRASLSSPATVSHRQQQRPPLAISSELSPFNQRIEALCRNGNLHGALQLLRDSPAGRRRSEATAVLLQACGDQGALDVGRQVHRIMSSEGLMADSVLTTRLVTMYATCGSSGESRAVFDSLESRNLYHWNALISGYSRNELWEEAMEAFTRMLFTTDLQPDGFTLPCVLRACARVSSMEAGKRIHGVAVKIGLDCDAFVCNSLISMYSRCGRIGEALQLFDLMPQRNLVSWNTMLRGLSEVGLAEDCLHLFRQLLLSEEEEEALHPDDATLVSVLPICAAEGLIEMGRLIHGLGLKLGLIRHLRVSNSLIDMYAKCGRLVESQSLFRELDQRNEVSWNTMIGGFSRSGEVRKTFELVREMAASTEEAMDEITILNASTACSEPAMIQTLKELHGYVIRNGIQSNDLLSNVLIAAYSKCGSSRTAEEIFFAMETKTVSSWNALMGGYAQNDDPQRAVDLHIQMVSSALRPDKFSVGSLLSAAARLRYLRGGRSSHGFILRNGFQDDSFIVVSLLSFYLQCGEVGSAEIIFNRMGERSSVAWNAMISGLAQNQLSGEALCYFRRMLAEGRRPSAIAATGVLTACGQLSALRQGKELHCFSLKADLSVDSFVGSSIIDMYAKCGAIDASRRFFDGFQKKDVVSWNVMIMGYGIHGQGLEAVELLERMEEVGPPPDSATFLGLLVACNHAGMVAEGLRYFEEMKTKHRVEPKMEHYACMADMLGRAGRLEEAATVAKEMPAEPDGRLWSSLLGACRNHGDVEMGEKIAARLLGMEPQKAEHYVLASNLFAASGRWDEVRSVRKTMKEMGLRKEPGCSWIDVDGKLYEFVAGDF
ncbi:unnamed protein product [Spirodela intermedia]|uniref:Uncharacterized protein n=1 Tax=Spirodela intermedia TaxID=51605 RepID=A0A7I8K9S4_SPIIN|nr:unnamed protein product [Spirodela intermedia]